MTDEELTERVAQIIVERQRGFYLDALELEVELWRDLALEASGLYFEQSNATAVHQHFKRVVTAQRALG